jgi:hypothetical protein
MFISTKNSYGENRKAMIKNANLPVLQEMYLGNETTPLVCLITKEPAFITTFPDVVTGQTKCRFRIDFNHIRQKSVESRQAGSSLDKSTHGPSHIFRSIKFTNNTHTAKLALLEFMTIMPICTEYHSYITQDSAKGDITLQNFNRDYWPWVLQNEANYKKFTNKYQFTGISYYDFINHLFDINQPSIVDRVKYNWSTGLWNFT